MEIIGKNSMFFLSLFPIFVYGHNSEGEILFQKCEQKIEIVKMKTKSHT